MIKIFLTIKKSLFRTEFTLDRYFLAKNLILRCAKFPKVVPSPLEFLVLDNLRHAFSLSRVYHLHSYRAISVKDFLLERLCSQRICLFVVNFITSSDSNPIPFLSLCDHDKSAGVLELGKKKEFFIRV